LIDSWKKIKDFIIKSKDLASVGSANLIGNGITAVFWLYLASLLGTEGYGEVSYFIAIATIGGVISLFGAGNTLMVYVPKGIKIQPAIFSMSLVASIITSIILFFLFFDAGISIFVIGFVIFNLALHDALGRKLYRNYAKYSLSQRILLIIFSISLYYLFGPSGVILGYALSFLPYVFRIYQTFSESKIDMSTLRPRFGFVMNSYGLDLSRTLSLTFDKLIVFPLFGFDLLGNYQLAIQFLLVLVILPSSIYQYILPQEAGGSSRKKLKLATVLVSFVLAGIGVLLGPTILPILFPQFEEAKELIQITSLAVIPISINLMYTSKFFSVEKSRIVFSAEAIFLVLLISGILFLKSQFGIMGAAMALVIAASCQSIFLISLSKIVDRKKDEIN